MTELLKRLIDAAVIVSLAWLLTGCCTIKGAAKDISWTAEKIDQSIQVPE